MTDDKLAKQLLVGVCDTCVHKVVLTVTGSEPSFHCYEGSNGINDIEDVHNTTCDKYSEDQDEARELYWY